MNENIKNTKIYCNFTIEINILNYLTKIIFKTILQMQK